MMLTRHWTWASAGGLIRAIYGVWVSCFSINMGMCSFTMAKLWGLYQGLIMAQNKDIRLLYVEVDSLCATQILQRRNGVTNASLPLINGILKLLSGSCQVYVNHLYCEVNCAADFLANHSLTLPLGLHFFLNSPSWSQCLVVQ